MKTPETITIDQTNYTRTDLTTPRPPSTTKIVILQRGWVMVGHYTQDGQNCQLTNASTIRQWGTTRGLGQLAAEGPTSKTVLDPCGTVRCHELTIVATIDCDATKWA